MPRIFFDARRKLTAAPTDREEGIIPYEPQIKLNPQFAVNYYQERYLIFYDLYKQ